MNAQLRLPTTPHRPVAPARPLAVLTPLRPAPLHRVRSQRLEPQQRLDLCRPGLVLVRDGAACLLAHDWSLPLPAGTVVVCDGREQLALRTGPADAALLTCFWPDAMALTAPPPLASRGEAPRNLLLPLVHAPGTQVALLMRQLAEHLERSQADVAEPRAAQACLGAVLAAQEEHAAAIARCHGRTHARRRDLYVRLARTRALLAAEVADALDVGALASIARLSTSHYVRLFHRVFGEPPHRFRSRVRMEHAHALLRGSHLPIAEILWQTGYTSHSCFARAFRQHFGCSASDVRAGRA